MIEDFCRRWVLPRFTTHFEVLAFLVDICAYADS